MKTLLTSLLVALTCSFGVAGADSLEIIKKDLARAGCVRFDFISTVTSDIFDQTDSLPGSAWLSSDGKYLIDLGDDQYLCDLQFLYSYSSENNQVTVEKLVPDTDTQSEISFIAHLDDFYHSSTITPDRVYRLVKRTEVTADIPDSLRVYIERDNPRLERVEYLDINEELNSIEFLDQELTDTCDSRLFEPAFPDSVETVRLW